jgi:protein O-GlcNAc transferase
MEQSARKKCPIETKLFDRAIEKHRNGLLDEARERYLSIIQAHPNHPDAMHLLGVVAFQAGSFDIAIESISNAVKLSPNRADFYHSLANAQRAGGFIEEALKNFQKAITLKSNYLEVYLSAGSLLEEQNRTDEAIACYRKALIVDPNSPTIWYLLGSIHIQRRELSKAIFSYQKAIQQSPNLSRAYNGLGIAFKEKNEHEKAIVVYRKAIKLSPDYFQAYFNLGFSQSRIGRYLDAIDSYKKALLIEPFWPEALQNLGYIYLKMGKIKDAIGCYHAALEQNPNLPETLNGLGSAYREAGRIEDALKCFYQALELKPNYNVGLKNIGLTLLSLGKSEAAKACFKKLIKVNRKFEYEVLMVMLHPIIYDSSEAILTHRNKFQRELARLIDRNETLDDPFERLGITNFILGMHGLKEKPLREQIAQFYLSVCPSLAWESPHLHDFVPGKKIRIGFVSNFLHEHTIGRLYHGLINKISRRKFHITIFRLNHKIDSITERIDRRADQVVYLPKKLKIAREIIADHKLDLLFYPEIGIDPFTYFLAFARLAPVQCKRGFQITMGIPNIDYFISSKQAEPKKAQDHYSEKLILMERTGYYYGYPELSDQFPTRKQLGLPEDKKLYACFQSLFKIHPEFDAVIDKILQKDPNGVLILLNGKHKHWETLLLNRFKKNIPDVKDRIYFIHSMQRDKFISLFLIVDAVLDTIYISGGNTSLECFAYGIPVVTWPSSYLPGRLTYGFYKLMGIMDCVAKDLEAYVDIAIKLANEKKWYAKVKKKIKQRSHLLFEDKLAVQEVERFFEWSVDRAYEKMKSF